MTETANIGNTYTIPKVLLSPITDDQAGILDNNLEPPFVRVRNRNASSTFLDNFDANSRLSNSSYQIASQGSLLSKRTKRFTVNKYIAQLPTPNINQRNNTITFTTGAGTFTVTIPEGFYTRTQAITALLTALNTVSGPSGVTFTAPDQFPGSDVYIVLTGTNPFRISGGTFVTTGYAFWGFLKGDTRLTPTAPLSTTLTLGPITAVYTRYYDICSTNLLQHTKAANTGNRVPANILLRVYAFTISQSDPTDSYFESHEFGPDRSSWNFDAGHSISSVDIQLYDEFNQPYYLPNSLTNASWLQMDLTNEL